MPLHLFSLSPKRTMNKWQSEAMLNFRGWQLIDINLEVCYKKRPFLEGGGGWSYESPSSPGREARGLSSQSSLAW